jgi:hypothetical protein
MKILDDGKRLVEQEDVMNLFNEMAPWDRREVAEKLSLAYDVRSDECLSDSEAFDKYGDGIIDYYDPSDLIDALEGKIYDVGMQDIAALARYKARCGFGTTPKNAHKIIEYLEQIIQYVQEDAGIAKDEILGTTSVVMDSDGDGIETKYEQWLTFHNTEFNLHDDTKFKEGDTIEIYARKINN